MDRGIDNIGLKTIITVYFNDNQLAHTQFWNKYQRPPKEEYWDYIVERRDLLVPQDVRERKGSFFTPRIWVELSQKYLADTLGEDWQDEYYVWDCAAGTGNLLAGLTNKYNIYASTLDQQDVEVMHDRINNGANLLYDHVFQFDFLNDDFIPKSKGGKLPDSLYKIISDPEKRKKLVVYINPPYAEATSATTVTGTGKNKSGVSVTHKANTHFKPQIGNASKEIFALFMAQIYEHLADCTLAQFSKLKFVQGSNFAKFKDFFKARFLGGGVVPANTFDNVKGSFPIGFTIWHTHTNKKIKNITCDVFDKNGEKIGKKTFYNELPESINKWIVKFENIKFEIKGLMVSAAPDFQHNKQVTILSKQQERYCFKINQENLIVFCIYFAVRHCIEATWLNDRDQFLYPNDGWKTDKEFQNDCLAFTLFNGQNRISCKEGINHWIPFTEQQVYAKERFESHFMSDFIKGKIKPNQPKDNLFTVNEPAAHYQVPLKFSPEAQAVFDAGQELWQYYHQQPNCNVNASLYDIKEYFQGRDQKGKMNNKSADEKFMQLIGNLRHKLKILAAKIQPKVYEYGFLIE